MSESYIPTAKIRTYEYIRYMRDGSVKRVTAVVRTRSKKKKNVD